MICEGILIDGLSSFPRLPDPHLVVCHPKNPPDPSSTESTEDKVEQSVYKGVDRGQSSAGSVPLDPFLYLKGTLAAR